MKHLLPLLLLSCTAPATPGTGKTDTVFIHDTVYYPHLYRDTLPFIVMFTPERYVEYYPDKDSFVVAGYPDSLIHGLTRLLYECK